MVTHQVIPNRRLCIVRQVLLKPPIRNLPPVRQRAENVMLQFRDLAGDAIDQLPLRDLELERVLVPEVRDGEDGVRAGEGGADGVCVVEIGRDDFGAEGGESLGAWLLGVAGHGADAVDGGGVGEDVAGGGTALVDRVSDCIGDFSFHGVFTCAPVAPRTTRSFLLLSAIILTSRKLPNLEEGK